MLGIIGSEMGGRAIAAIHEHEQIISALEKKDKESFVTAIEDNVCKWLCQFDREL